MFEDISIPEMPTNKDDAAGWVAWFGACMQALINILKSLFGKLKELGGKEEETTA